MEHGQLSCTLKNISNKPINIPWTTNPILENLKGVVRNPDGTLDHYEYGKELTPITSTPEILTLHPRQMEKVEWGMIPIGGAGPGVYQVHFIFEYDGMKAISPPVQIELKTIK